MAFDFNPITGQLDLVGGGSSYIDGDVQYHADLPVTVGTPAVNSAFLVRKGQGLYFLTRKPAGIWVRELNNGNLDDWKYAGTFSDLYRDEDFRIINDTDTSKELAFSLSGITTGTTRTLTVPNSSGTIQLTGHAAAHATGGSDAVSPFSIGAESIFDATGNTLSGTPVTLTASRARVWTFPCFSATTVTLPTTGVEFGDRIVVRGGSPVTAAISISSTGVSDTIQNTDEQFSYTYLSTGTGNRWVKNLVDNHDASRVNSGTFANARINFAAPAAIGNTTPNTLAGTQLALHDGSDTGTFVAASKLTANRTYDLPDASGTIALTNGSNSIWIAASSFIPRTTNGCGVDSRETSTNRTNWDELLFDAGADEFAQAVVVMPSNYNNGNITARFYWTASGATDGSDNVVWGIQGRAFADDDALDQAMGTAQTVQDTVIATNDMHVSAATSAVTIAGTPAAQKPILFQIYRDADATGAGGDDYSHDARLLGVEIIYTAA